MAFGRSPGRGIRRRVIASLLFTSPDYSVMTMIEERALQSEGNGPLPRRSPQTNVVERTPGKNASAESSTKDGIEDVRLCAFTPPGSLRDRLRVVAFPRTMNNAG